MHTTVNTVVIIISDMTGVLRQLLKHIVVQILQELGMHFAKLSDKRIR